MARGYPDYFGYSMFPFYGPPLKIDWNTGVFATGLTAEAFEITHKGRILSGWIQCYSVDGTDVFAFNLTIDGVAMYQTTPAYMLWHNLTEQDQSLIYIRNHDKGLKYFGFCLSKDIAFGSQFKLEIVNGTTGNMQCLGHLYYNTVLS